MQDPRLRELAKVLVHHSTRLQKGEKILIEAFDVPARVVQCLIEEIVSVGALPFVTLKNNQVLRALYIHATEAQMAEIGAIERFRMEKMDAYIGIRGADIPDGPRFSVFQLPTIWKFSVNKERN